MKKLARKLIKILDKQFQIKKEATIIKHLKQFDIGLYLKVEETTKQIKSNFGNSLWLVAHPNINICNHPTCKNRTKAGRGNWGAFKRYCSIKCGNSDPSKLRRSASTCLERYGVSNVSKAKHVKQKKVQTCRENFGVDFPQQCEKIRSKLERNNLKKYGKANVGQVDKFKQKRVNSFLAKYGVDNPRKATQVKEAMKATCMKKYGVEHHSKVPEIIEKSIRSRVNPFTLTSKKKTMTINGKLFVYQGFENLALAYMTDILGIDVKYITNTKTKVYEYKDEKTNKIRRYFPDFKVKFKGEIIHVEVKSIVTLLGITSKKSFRPFGNVLSKAKAVHEAGDKLMLLVFESKRSQTPIIKSLKPHCATLDKTLKVLASKSKSRQVTRLLGS